MNDLIKRLRQEAGRNAQMQGDKEHQTNRRRKTFRGRNRLFTEAASTIEDLRYIVSELLGTDDWVLADEKTKLTAATTNQIKDK